MNLPNLLSGLVLLTVASADIRNDLQSLINAPDAKPGATADFIPQGITFSQSRHAICLTGIAKVPVTSRNIEFKTQIPPHQSAATEMIQEILETNSAFIPNNTIGPQTISTVYGIQTDFCYPATLTSATQVKTIQILTHGTGLQRNYWDIPGPNNSYVDAAAMAGYATLSYDRLGNLQSDHPDPINAVQSAMHVEILEGLIQGVRKGTFGLKKFDNVVCAGHSYGQIIQTGHDNKYPSSCSAVLATGVSGAFQYLSQDTLALNPTIAHDVDPGRFGNLSNAFFTYPTSVSVQLPFFRYPYFDPDVFDAVFATRGTYTIGELLTLPAIFTPAPAFTGPVAVINGEFDFAYCGGECGQLPDLYRTTFYPTAGRAAVYLIPNTGHIINAHATAPQAFQQMLSFLKENGL
ncbi:hypothetical protein K461DRAFT_256055 [Myriangium duriaei CBS 260.36]|uniref:AB hydrolase-1 domain-containing protein n=1 Tax=Myriangium duriaei CBS 260.36 TaxID=1168546 RepID=A0A9P4J0Q8_9PEZI|nr:hypothetical protein K461DRAFT_256055 [Myriangium duriaei CBS 260.36]